MRATLAIGLSAAVLALAACNAVLGLDAVETRGGTASASTTGAGGAGGGATAAGGAGGATSASTTGAGGAGGATTTSTTTGSGGGSTTGGCGTGGDPTGGGGGGGITWTEIPINGGFESWSGALPDGWADNNGSALKAPCVFHGANTLRIVTQQNEFGSLIRTTTFHVEPGDWVRARYSMRVVAGNVLNPGIHYVDTNTIDNLGFDNFSGLGADWKTREALFHAQSAYDLLLQIEGQDGNDAGGAALEVDDVHLWVGK